MRCDLDRVEVRVAPRLIDRFLEARPGDKEGRLAAFAVMSKADAEDGERLDTLALCCVAVAGPPGAAAAPALGVPVAGVAPVLGLPAAA